MVVFVSFVDINSRLVTQHPVPLSVDRVADGDIGIEGTRGIETVVTRQRVFILPVTVEGTC